MAGQSEPVRQSAGHSAGGRPVSAEVHASDCGTRRSGGCAGMPLRLIRPTAASGVPQVSRAPVVAVLGLVWGGAPSSD